MGGFEEVQQELLKLRLDELKIVARFVVIHLDLILLRELGCFVCVKGFSYLDKSNLLNFIMSKYEPICNMVGEKTLREFFDTTLKRYQSTMFCSCSYF